MVTASESGIANQIPDTSITLGKRIKNITTRISDLRDETRAERKPLPKAVKYPEMKTL